MAHKSKKCLEILEITYAPEIVTQIPKNDVFWKIYLLSKIAIFLGYQLVTIHQKSNGTLPTDP